MLTPIETGSSPRLASPGQGEPGSLQATAYRRDVLFPRMRQAIRPAVFLPGQIERVTGTLPHFRLDDVIKAATAKEVTHSPTIAYHVTDAVLRDGSVYAGDYQHPIADSTLFDAATAEEQHLESAALASSYMGTKYFGHWLRDDCTQYVLAETMAPPLCVGRPTFRHQREYQSYFDQDWRPTDRARIDHLIIFQDFAPNPLKRVRYDLLRQRVKRRFAGAGARRCVYLRRGNTGSPRPVENEQEVSAALMRRGFLVVDIESDELLHIIATLIDAEIVVSMEGSHIAHCTFACPANSALLVLQPPDRFSLNHRDWAEALGIRFGFVVGSIGAGGYRFAPPEILRTIDYMLKGA